MSDWTTVPSPFLSPRAQLRAPQALAFAGVTGAAMVISRGGEVALFSGTAHDLDAGHIARLAVRSLRAAHDDLVSFSYEGCCVHAGALGFGRTLSVVSTIGVSSESPAGLEGRGAARGRNDGRTKERCPSAVDCRRCGQVPACRWA